MPNRIILHEDARSGNCYKIRLTAALVGQAIERRGYDIMRGDTRTPEFLATVNANGRIPVLQIGDWFLPESNAACYWLGEGSSLIPTSRNCRADMLHWMFWEQYNHEPNVATMRFWRVFKGIDQLAPAQQAAIPGKMLAGEAALALMDQRLADREWLVSDHVSLADICLYPYTHVAGEGGFALADYPAVQRWIKRIEKLPGYLPMSA